MCDSMRGRVYPLSWCVDGSLSRLKRVVCGVKDDKAAALVFLRDVPCRCGGKKKEAFETWSGGR